MVAREGWKGWGEKGSILDAGWLRFDAITLQAPLARFSWGLSGVISSKVEQTKISNPRYYHFQGVVKFLVILNDRGNELRFLDKISQLQWTYSIDAEYVFFS